MSDAAVADDVDLDGDVVEGEGGEATPKRFSGKFIVLFIVAPVLALALIVGGLYFAGVFGGEDHAEAAADGAASSELMGEPIYYDLPEFLVNLNTPGPSVKYLKLLATLQIASPEDAEKLDIVMPRVIDGFQVYLRSLRPEDFAGSTGMLNLKVELLKRINAAADPVPVHDILFKEILIQ